MSTTVVDPRAVMVHLHDTPIEKREGWRVKLRLSTWLRNRIFNIHSFSYQFYQTSHVWHLCAYPATQQMQKGLKTTCYICDNGGTWVLCILGTLCSIEGTGYDDDSPSLEQIKLLKILSLIFYRNIHLYIFFLICETTCSHIHPDKDPYRFPA